MPPGRVGVATCETQWPSNGSGQGGQKSCPANAARAFQPADPRRRVVFYITSLWCGRAASSGILSVVLQPDWAGAHATKVNSTQRDVVLAS